jgi:hypothetical protein
MTAFALKKCDTRPAGFHTYVSQQHETLDNNRKVGNNGYGLVSKTAG